MIYNTFLGVGTILFLMIIFTITGYIIFTTSDIFTSLTPSTFMSESVNTTSINEKYQLGGNVFYYSFFFLTIVILIWIYKKAVEYKRMRGLYG